MTHRPATQALCAAPETKRPRATAASAVEGLLLALLHSLLMALLPATASPRAALLSTPSPRRLVALLLRLQARAEAREAGAWIPRCQRQDEGERQILLALACGGAPRPRVRALPAEMPPARPRLARAPPRARLSRNSLRPAARWHAQIVAKSKQKFLGLSLRRVVGTRICAQTAAAQLPRFGKR